MSNVLNPDAENSGAKRGKNARAGSVFLIITVLLWSLVVVTGIGYMLRYSNTPGAASESPAHWPAASQIAFDTNRPTLLLFAHPHCPCTRATLSELEQLMADCHGQVDAQVWFVKPASTEASWTNTDLWTTAAAIPGVSVHCDADGLETQRFHAETSGQALLYDCDGQLLFHGGITIARGHAGDNPGLSTIEALLQHKPSNLAQTPVFGCQLLTERKGTNQAACPACQR